MTNTSTKTYEISFAPMDYARRCTQLGTVQATSTEDAEEQADKIAAAAGLRQGYTGSALVA